jgi:gag-polypeptide of LTR copia-type
MVHEFMPTKIDDLVNMKPHIQRIKRLKQQVKEQKERILDIISNSVLLSSLPKDYKIVISILESTSDITPHDYKQDPEGDSENLW